jgi:hypothetical protein
MGRRPNTTEIPTVHNRQARMIWANFARGYNSVRTPVDLMPDELADVMNFRYVQTPRGIGLTCRPGMVKMTTAAIVSTTNAVYDIHKYVTTAGVVKYMAVTNSAMYMSTGVSGGTMAFSSLGTLAGSRGRMVNFAGKCIVADGGTPKKYDGTTWGTCTATVPSATMLAVHGDRMLYNSETVKNTIWYTNVRDAEDVTTAGAAGSIIFSEINEVSGFSKFYGQMLISGTGPKNIMALTGTTPTDFQVGRAIPGAAAVGPDQAIVLSNDVLFLDAPGLISLRAWEKYGNIEQAIVSDNVSNLLLPTLGTNMVCGRNPIDQQAWFWDGSSTYILVYDAQYGIWTKYWLELGTGVKPTCIADLDGQLYVGTSNGNVWRMDITGAVFQDNAVAYSLYWKSGAYDFGTLLQKQVKWLNGQINAGNGASAYLDLYKDLSAAPVVEVSLAAPASRYVGSATDTVGAATYLVDESGGVLKNTRVNFECKYIQIGMSSCNPNNSRFDVSQTSVEVAFLNRF